MAVMASFSAAHGLYSFLFICVHFNDEIINDNNL